jgi:hypothetical protein
MYFINDGTNRLNRGHEPLNPTNNFLYLKYGEVVSVDDDYSLGRIKVRIKGAQSVGGDDGKLDNDLPYCFPMMPKHVYVPPKVGEMVWIFVFDKNRQHIDRLYIGPIISQPDKLNKDDARTTALAGFSFGSITPNVNVERIPQLNGVFPSKNDISIQGRYNTDITQKPNEVLLRAGKFEYSTPSTDNPYSFKFNKISQGFIQIKSGVIISPKTETDSAKKGSVTNVVSNKINLITHNGSPTFNVTNQEDLISDSELAKILTDAHPLPFGDVLVEYLILLKEALFAHVHNGNGKPATDLTSSGNKQALTIFKNKSKDLEKAMLSKNIRIN